MAVGKRIALAFAVVVVCLGADKKAPEGTASNSKVEITAKLYADKDEIKKIVGSDLDGYFTLVDVRLVPAAGSKLAVTRDDFVLRSDKDGQRASPFHPSQVAGSGVLVVTTTESGAVKADKGGHVWGPPMGGQPKRVGNTGGSSVGNAAGGSQAGIGDPGKTNEDPLLAVLKEKVLAEQEIAEPTSGLLYFLLEGKHRPKDLELMYKGPAGRLSLRFKN
jgi:hypothetical protein